MARSALLLLLSGFLLSGCVGRRLYHDREVAQNGSYFSGKSLPMVRGVFSRPNENKEFREDDAVIGLLASAFFLAQNPGYYSKSSIGGRCVTGPAEAKPLQLPCVNVTFVLTSEEGKETDRQYSESGSFEFFVESGKHYFVSVLSREQRQGKVGPVRMGDEVVIRLGAKESASTVLPRVPGRS